MERKIIAGFDREQIVLHHEHPVPVVVTTSTFPVNADDPVPRFVLDQITHMAAQDPALRFHVLIPHNSYGPAAPDRIELESHVEIRYHYFWPRSFEKLSGRGILPALRGNPLRYLLIPFFLAAQSRALRKLCEQCDARLIYAHWYMPQGVVAQRVARKLGISLMLTTHASDVSVLARVPLAKRLIESGLRQAHCITAVSKRTADRLLKFFSAEQWKKDFADKLSIIPMGTNSSETTLPPESVQPHLEALGLNTNQTYILSLGRLSEKKGLRYLIEAYSQLPSETQAAHQLVIAGDGELAQELKTQVLGLELESQVTFTGFVQGEQKQALLHAAELFVLPSIIDAAGDSEGLPVALMEALTEGKLVIATDVSGAEEVLTNNCGVLVKQRSATELAAAIQHYIGMSAEDKATQMQTARELAKRFEWPGVAQQHLKLIRAALEAEV